MHSTNRMWEVGGRRLVPDDKLVCETVHLRALRALCFETLVGELGMECKASHNSFFL